MIFFAHNQHQRKKTFIIKFENYFCFSDEEQNGEHRNLHKLENKKEREDPKVVSKEIDVKGSRGKSTTV